MLESTANDRQKKGSGGLACIVWLASTFYIFIVSDYGPNLLSWQALTFAILGMFAAAILLGSVFYILQRLVASPLSNLLDGASPSRGAIGVVAVMGFLLMIIQVAATFFAAQLTHTYFFG